jgi:hypothetical protein
LTLSKVPRNLVVGGLPGRSPANPSPGRSSAKHPLFSSPIVLFNRHERAGLDMSTKQIISFVLLTLASRWSVAAPTDSTNQLKDVFPLRVGHNWTYDYYRLSVQRDWFPPSSAGSSDSGQVSYSVLDSVSHADSVTWVIGITQRLTHKEWGGYDTLYSIDDTTQFNLYELLSGNHHLVAEENPVWQFLRVYCNAVEISRYQMTDSGSYAHVNACIPTLLPLYSFTFQGDTGLISAGYSMFSNTWTFILDVGLTNCALTDVSSSAHDNAKVSSATLNQNYPNPFNPSTTIKYELPKASDVRLAVYDLLGREVSVLVNERRDAGVHEVKFDGDGISNGVYFYRLTAGNFVQTRKLLLLK